MGKKVSTGTKLSKVPTTPALSKTATFGRAWAHSSIPPDDHGSDENTESVLSSDAEHVPMPTPRLSAASQGSGHKTGLKAKAKKRSAREERRTSEIPTWKKNSLVQDLAASDEEHSDTSNTQEEGTRDPHKWPAETRIALNARGKVNLTEQQPHIQEMLRKAIRSAQRHISFEHSYPDITEKRRTTADILYVAAGETFGCELVQKRLSRDPHYARALASVPDGRVTKFRLRAKAIAQRYVASAYGLEKGCDPETVRQLLEKNTYIFPVNDKGEPIRSKPFESTAILRTIEDTFFEDDSSVGLMYPGQYISTSLSRPNEMELPPAMVAMASTAVFAVIMEFLGEGKEEFNSHIFASVYEHLMDFIDAFYDGSEGKYHTHFAKLYTIMHASKKKNSVGSESGKVLLMHLDLDAMEED
ncbi:hypothetical protein BDN67DRAFT_976724 [Paxillus ammoniavirescens]|nr:hypothetical protein BDN67DRAFT_976724 [Paxillus ammoniavirescens]